jgi:hypothetical protein
MFPLKNNYFLIELEPTGKFNEESSLKFELIMILLFLTNVDDDNTMIIWYTSSFSAQW